MKSHIIVIWSRKGGVGKTSISWLLLTYLWSLGRSVLSIDADPQRNLTSRFRKLFGLSRDQLSQRTIVQLLLKSHSISEVAAAINDPEYPLGPTHIVPGNFDLGDLAIDKYRFAEVLDPARSEFEFVVMDMGPNFSPVVGSALWAADTIIIPSFVAEEELDQAAWSYKKCEKWVNGNVPRKILLNAYQEHRSNDLMRDQLESFAQVVPRSDWLQASVPEAKSLIRNHYTTGEKLTMTAEKKRPFVEGFGQLVEEVLGIKERVEVF